MFCSRAFPCLVRSTDFGVGGAMTGWKSGYMLPDGAGFDKRVQFGQKEAPVLTSRQSNFLVWAIRRELHAFDEAHAPRDAALLAWRLLRELLAEERRPQSERPCFADPWTSLNFVMQYVDDLGAVSVDDFVYDADGAPYHMRMDESLQSRVGHLTLERRSAYKDSC